MSSMKKSPPGGGLQRSRSSSGIPLPGRLSRLPVRNSALLSAKKSRGQSLSRPVHEKRSLDRNFARSSSNLSVNDLPAYSRKRSGSLIRRTLTTPLNQHSNLSRRKSPLQSSARKDTRPITDKKWQSEQLMKVRHFVTMQFSHLESQNIKPGLPLDLFVSLMHAYFEVIDRRINITRGNYIEEVPCNLKRFHYPASVKPSLMKTANAPMSWSSILAILSWLTDIARELTTEEEDVYDVRGVVDDCMMEMNYQWNMGQDDSASYDAPVKRLDEELVRFLYIDQDEEKSLDDAITYLLGNKVKYEQSEREIMEKIQGLQSNIQNIKGKCDRYEVDSQDYEKSVMDAQAAFVDKIRKIDRELLELVKSEDQLKSTIATQPYSVAQKHQLREEIESIQNTIKLKEERCQELRELVCSYDFQFSDLKQKVEAEAHKCNNIVTELELINPELKVLHIRESGFVRINTESELMEVGKLVKMLITKSKEDLKECQRMRDEFTEKQKLVDEELATEGKQLESLLKEEAELSITLDHRLTKSAVEKEKAMAELKKCRNNLLKLKNCGFDLAPLKQEQQTQQKQKADLIKFKQELQGTALEFFIKLDSQVSNQLNNYLQITMNISDNIQSCQEEFVQHIDSCVKNVDKTNEQIGRKG